MGFLTEDDAPVIWRGPMLHGAIQQFFRDVRWNDIDYLIVDMPPGTGDVALSLSQSVPVAGAVLVTTPQTVSLADTRRAVQMYRKLNIPTLGLIENMSYFVCPGCGDESDIFGKGGGEAAGDGADACRSSAAFRSTSRCGAAATPACRSSSADPDSPPALRAHRGRRARRAAGLDRVVLAPRDSADGRSELTRARFPFTKQPRSPTASTSSCTRTTACRSSR